MDKNTILQTFYYSFVHIYGSRLFKQPITLNAGYEIIIYLKNIFQGNLEYSVNDLVISYKLLTFFIVLLLYRFIALYANG